MPPHGRGAARPKEKADFKALGKVLAYMKGYWPALFFALVFAALGAVATIVMPDQINELVTLIQKGIFTGIDLKEVARIGTLLISIYAVGALLSYAQQFITATITQRVARKLRHEILDKINNIPLSYFDSTTKGNLLSVVTNDVDTIAETLSGSIANILSSAVLFLGVLIKMFLVNWLLAFITVGIALLGFIAMGIILGVSQKYFNRKQRDLAEMNGQIEEVFSSHKMVRIYGGKSYEDEIFDKTNAKLFVDNWKSQSFSRMMYAIMGFVSSLTNVAIFIVGVYFILDGNEWVTLGTITSFLIYARLFSQPLSTFAQSMTSFQQASAASKRVFGLLEQPSLSDESHKKDGFDIVKGDVSFEDVRFGYEEGKEIIHGFSASVKAGQKVAIVGPTGAGKTTIVNLLMRFYEMGSGDIKVDGVSIKDVKRAGVHDLFDMILQDTWLFNGTIKENLVYNKEGVTKEQLDQAISAVGLSHFIKTLPDGYDTVIDEAMNLSEGQKQQLTIARAMIKDSPLLILDEATSSVDTRTEAIIQKAMDELTKDRTSFVIAHRLSTIRNADIIFVLNHGDIVETGTHEELLAKNGFYAELYNSQFVNA